MTSEKEINVLENIKRKEQQAEIMAQNMVNLTKEVTIAEIMNTTRTIKKYEPEKAITMPEWLRRA